MPSRRTHPATVIASLGVGFAYAAVLVWMLMGLSGAGHGWSASGVTGLGVVLIPIASVAFAHRRRILGTSLALGTLVFAVLVDLMLVEGTREEGVYYFRKVWEGNTGFVISFLAWWGAWQFMLVWIAVRAMIPSRKRADDLRYRGFPVVRE
jgi:hypothetical protein